MATKQLFNTKTQQLEDATLSVDESNEIVATFADLSFIKFPAGLDQAQFDELVAQHQSANEGQEVVTAEQEAAKTAERANSYALIGESDPATQQATEEATEATEEATEAQTVPSTPEAPVEEATETPAEESTEVNTGDTTSEEVQQSNATDTTTPTETTPVS